MEKHSRMALWNKMYADNPSRAIYGDPLTAVKASAYLSVPEIVSVEDWGCGFGGFRELLAGHQRYIGVDGSLSPYADKIVDLAEYTSDVDAIHMRHVLEHNPDWKRILDNSLRSFRHRMVLTIFTPWAKRTTILASYPDFLGSGVTMIDLSFCREDIISRFKEVKWHALENIPTGCEYGMEHMFFLQRPN